MVRARLGKASLVPGEREGKASDGFGFGGFIWPSLASVEPKQTIKKKKKNTQQQLNHTTVRMHEGKDEVPFPNFSHFLSYSTKLCELKG